MNPTIFRIPDFLPDFLLTESRVVDSMWVWGERNTNRREKMKTKTKTTWHIELPCGKIIDFATRQAAKAAAHEILGDERLCWKSTKK